MHNDRATDQRRDERLPVLQNVYVLVNTEPQMLGQMVEISHNGLAFTVVDLDLAVQHLKARGSLQVDLFQGGQGYLVRNLPCRMISKIDRRADGSISHLSVKRIGLEFDGLTLSQQVRINHFMRDCLDHKQHIPSGKST